jgi:hypothetical protein
MGRSTTLNQRFPTDIPLDPNSYYKGKGWNGFADFLGTTRQWLPFEQAREFVRSLGIKSQDEYLNYCRSGKRQTDIPSDPDRVYKGRAGMVLLIFLVLNGCPLKKRGRKFVP